MEQAWPGISKIPEGLPSQRGSFTTGGKAGDAVVGGFGAPPHALISDGIRHASVSCERDVVIVIGKDG